MATYQLNSLIDFPYARPKVMNFIDKNLEEYVEKHTEQEPKLTNQTK